MLRVRGRVEAHADHEAIVAKVNGSGERLCPWVCRLRVSRLRLEGDHIMVGFLLTEQDRNCNVFGTSSNAAGGDGVDGRLAILVDRDGVVPP